MIIYPAGSLGSWTKMGREDAVIWRCNTRNYH